MKKGLTIAAWNLGLLVVALVAVELIFGSWLKAPGLWNLGIYREVEWRFNVAGRYATDKPDIVYKRDYYGLRGAYGRVEDIDVLVLGGSTTDQRFVDEGRTWTDALMACRRSQGKTAHIANAGVAGQTTRGHAANFDVWLARIPGLKPRTVVALIGVNENVLDERDANDDVRRYHETATPLSTWHNVRMWLRMNSALNRLYTVVKGNLKAYRAQLHPARDIATTPGETTAQAIDRQVGGMAHRRVALESREWQARIAQQRQVMASEIEGLNARLAALADRIRAFGAQPLFITQNSAAYRKADGEIRGDLESYFRLRVLADAVVAFGQAHNIAVLDLAGDLFMQDGDAYDSVHTTDRGSRRIGEWVCAHWPDGY
ncbi:MAG: SGNH/GDSL hydrolase family protein [Rhodospirillales bacterium]|nr:SGNH/GDSL hydrolase family protein [Rhodospirillales bacterium]